MKQKIICMCLCLSAVIQAQELQKQGRGEYYLRFRLKSNHDIGCTMKITIKPKE